MQPGWRPDRIDKVALSIAVIFGVPTAVWVFAALCNPNTDPSGYGVALAVVATPTLLFWVPAKLIAWIFSL